MAEYYPASEFDKWADTYDQDVLSNRFPFQGYAQTLDRIVQLSESRVGMKILDIGTGTGKLARKFLDLGCIVTGIDYSTKMLEKAAQNLPGVILLQADLRYKLPEELKNLKFDRLVSAYVFHHFLLTEKISIIHKLSGLLNPGGFLIIGDISFQDLSAKELVKTTVGFEWEDEEYWIAAEAIFLMQDHFLKVSYEQTSPCAGVYRIGF